MESMRSLNQSNSKIRLNSIPVGVNIIFCASIKIFLSCHQHIFDGPDRTFIYLNNFRFEVENYLEGNNKIRVYGNNLSPYVFLKTNKIISKYSYLY